MNTHISYIEANRQRMLDELLELLRIPSVSADPKYKDEVKRTAEWVAEALRKAGVNHVEICPTAGHPIVYAEHIVSNDVPTVLCYGHYDVQPPDPLDLWTSPPFEPVIKDGKIYARGSADDKGQFYMHIKAFEVMKNTTGIPCNIKFLIEGEEEVGSDNLYNFVKTNAQKLKADVVLISDTHMIANDIPSIEYGLRGLSYMEVELTGPNKDLHSGLFGGAVDNPINVLCKMIASLKDENNRITIPGFYDKVVNLTPEERAFINQAPFNHEEYCKALEIADTNGEKGYTVLEQTSIRPTLDVNGIWGGYTGEGAKTVLPSKAYAKISMRLVPNQDPQEISELFEKHFISIAPKTVKVKVSYHHGGYPAVTPIDSAGFQAASKAMEATFGKKPVPTRGGGSIPIVALFERELGIKSVLMGFGLESDAIHSPNEHYGIFNYFKGIETIPLFHQYFAELA